MDFISVDHLGIERSRGVERDFYEGRLPSSDGGREPTMRYGLKVAFGISRKRVVIILQDGLIVESARFVRFGAASWKKVSTRHLQDHRKRRNSSHNVHGV